METRREPQYPSPRPILSFPEWLDFWANSDLDRSENKAHFSEEMDHFETRASYAEYSLWALEEPTRLLQDFDIATLGRLFGRIPVPFSDPRLPLPLRLALIRAQRNVFFDIFLPILNDSVPSPAQASVAETCFIWWDNCMFEDPALAHAARETWRELLHSGSAVLQEAALHGLGHQIFLTEQILGAVDTKAIELVDHFLEYHVSKRGPLYEYAREARIGNVL